MRRRHGQYLFLLALGVITFGLAAPAYALDGPLELRFIEQTTSEAYIDAGDPGESAGDSIVFTNRLVNAQAQLGKPRGAAVGRDAVRVTFIARGFAEIAGTAFLPNGKIVVAGAVRESAGADYIPVVGGTGTYANARGVVIVRDLPNDRTLLTFRLRPGG